MATKFALDPCVSLSPASPTGCRNPPHQTTPTLPRRDRAASFSRLLTSDKFLELLPSQQRGAGRRARSRGGPPSILLTPCSPPEKDPAATGHGASPVPATGNGVLDSQQLPFSPRLLTGGSPSYLSPHYTRPTPTRSPLYTPNAKGAFLGRGSFGNVTLCVYKDSKFALKVSRRKENSAAGEANLLNIRHPHLVRVLHVKHVLDKVLVFMEFAGHCNLQQVLDTKSELDFPRRLSFCVQTLSGLRHCHRSGIVHSDVKPANVMVSAHGVCKLCDFGLSFRAGQADPPAIGTAAYTAPEVLRGAPPTPMSDVYSFGVLLWQVHSRELPFLHEHPHVVIYKVGHYGARPVFGWIEDRFEQEYADVARMCWRGSPQDRPDASQALELLQDIATEVKGLGGR